MPETLSSSWAGTFFTHSSGKASSSGMFSTTMFFRRCKRNLRRELGEWQLCCFHVPGTLSSIHVTTAIIATFISISMRRSPRACLLRLPVVGPARFDRLECLPQLQQLPQRGPVLFKHCPPACLPHPEAHHNILCMVQRVHRNKLARGHRPCSTQNITWRVHVLCVQANC